jgi:hypothetical protein
MRLYPAERLNMGISAGAVAASYAVATPEFASSLALGAAIEAMNFRFLHRSGEALFDGVVNGARPWVSVLALRFGLLAGGIGIAITVGADPLALVIGLSLAMPATVIAAVWKRPKVIEQEADPGLPPDDPSWDRYSVWRAAEVEEKNEDEQ